jgi:hypothetical protein
VIIDHLLVGCRDLEHAMSVAATATGVQPVVGGVHPGLGTRNALLSLGDERYLELIAPDPQQAVLTWFRDVNEMIEPHLVGWAARVTDMNALAARLAAHGVGFAGPTPGSRARTDGVVLRWRTLTLDDDAAGLLPFFIEWSPETIHPSLDAPRGCALDAFGLIATDVAALTASLDLLELDVPVKHGSVQTLRARVRGMDGRHWDLGSEQSIGRTAEQSSNRAIEQSDKPQGRLR